MNASLLNPFNITYPTAVQTSLPSQASLARWDPTGRYIAAGRNDGTALIWDLETHAAVRWLEGHVKGITNVDWSRHSRYVLTSSKDWNVIIWDLMSEYDPPQRLATIRFDAPVTTAWFHPKNSQIIVALLATGDAYVVDRRQGHQGRIELEELLDEDEDTPRSAMTSVRFDPSGKHVFVGTSAGSILVFNSRTKIMVARHKILGAGVIRSLVFAKSGRRLVTNSSDRMLRMFTVPTYLTSTPEQPFIEHDLEPSHRFSDPINRNAWHAMSFSPDGEWLAGGASDAATHKIYVWDISNDGQFASALDGGREPLIYAHWHPSKASIVSTTNQGNLLIWHCPTPERWGAFAGGFEEVDENVEYQEREDEFDIEDESEIALRKMKQEEEEVDIETGVDIGEVAPMRTNGDADEDAVWALDEEDGDVAGWTMKLVMEAEEDI